VVGSGDHFLLQILRDLTDEVRRGRLHARASKVQDGSDRLVDANEVKRMTRTATTICTLALVAITVLGVSASPILDSDDFEGYTLGDLFSQSDWTQVQGVATVQNTVFQDGGQAIQLNNDTIVDRDLSGAAAGQDVVYTQTYYRGAGTTSPANYPPAPGSPASAIVHFSAGGDVGSGLQGPGIFLANGDGAGNVTWVRANGSSGTALNPNVFYAVTIRQNYTAGMWDCWINGELAGENLGFRDSVTQLNGFRVYAGVQSYMDTFLVQRKSQSDLDGDGDSDAADVVLNVNATDVQPDNPIAFDDADQNDDGVIDGADVDATVQAVLNFGS
jgi:hypothetical protein